MKLLKEEIELRDETRSLQQARAALKPVKYRDDAKALAQTQFELSARAGQVITKLTEHEKAASFGKEVQLMVRVREVMDEAGFILARPDTGPEAIAAETEVIELLLQAKRANPKSGGGGGASPGGGGQGNTDQSALAMLGSGDERNADFQRRDVSQATGSTGRILPEEYRAGLDAYFDAIENR